MIVCFNDHTKLIRHMLKRQFIDTKSVATCMFLERIEKGIIEGYSILL